jgi:hypothetical protein
MEAERRIEASEIWPTIGSKRACRQKDSGGDGQRRRESGAYEVGTAMALRGEHDARSASTQEEGKLN